MGRILPILLALAALALSTGPALAAQPVIEAVRFGTHEERTRVVIEIDRPVTAQVFALEDPGRIVIDLPEATWRAGAETGGGFGVVAGFRSGLFKPGTTRLVLDLAAPADIAASFTLWPEGDRPARVVVDLGERPTGAGMRPAAVTVALPSTPEAARPGAPERDPLAIPQRKPDRTIPTIVLDPGHGGVDPGAVNGDIYEKHIAMSFARELRRQLEATGRYTVQLTRDRDIYLPLRERVRLARAAGADLFMSLHADSLPRQNVRGASVYTLSETASDEEAARLAARENRADIIAGIDLDREEDEVAGILIDLAMRDSKNQAKRMAVKLIEELQEADIALLRNTHRSAGFAVLKAPDVPSLLFEIGYLSSPGEAQLLMRADHQARVARATVAAIDRYFEALQIADRS